MNKGFGVVGILLIIAITVVVAGGSGYGVYKYNKLVDEKRELEQRLKQETSLNEVGDMNQEEQTKSHEYEPEEEETVSKKESDNSSIKTYLQGTYASMPESEPTDTVKPVEDTGESQLNITNVETTEMGDATHITWETNIPSDSRIIIDDDFYVSDNGYSTKHSVTFTDLLSNSVINYEIVAESALLKASKYGKFTTRIGELDARFSYSKDEECIVVTIEDENGAAQSGILLEISSDWYTTNGSRFLNPKVTQTTSMWGEVEYCEKNIENIKVENANTGKIYHNGTLPLYW